MTTARDSFSRFTRAIVRPPARNFAQGLTTVDLGVPDVERAIAQHTAYCAALVKHGCALIELPADDRFPDSTFVEDAALILPGQGAILTRPGAQSRAGEVHLIREPVTRFFATPHEVITPGTLDAGDVCETESMVLIGISKRTNAEGAQQLSDWLITHGHRSAVIDITNHSSILHLKSGVTALGDGRLLAIKSLVPHAALREFNVMVVPDGEEYAANCVRVNDVVFVAKGFPRTHELLRNAGYQLEIIDMSEFEKMDGGLSCLSLRF